MQDYKSLVVFIPELSSHFAGTDNCNENVTVTYFNTKATEIFSKRGNMVFGKAED